MAAIIARGVGVVVLVVLLASCSSATESAVDVGDYRFVIPAGYGAAIVEGSAEEIFPTRLDVNVGDELKIVNLDSQEHTIGPFFVEAGETLEKFFFEPGVFEGLCSAHSGGQITVVVSPAP
jgi:plastocyanin